MSRPLYFPVSNFQVATPGFDDAGEVHRVLSPIIALTPLYNDDETDQFDFVQPWVAGWNGEEHPDQLIKRPNSMFVDKYGRVGDEQAALRLFQNSDRRIRAQQTAA